MQTTMPTINLSPSILAKLAKMAKDSGISLKSYIESILTDKANESPSPSNDPWFDNPQNIQMVKHGIQQINTGKGKTYTASELKSRLEL